MHRASLAGGHPEAAVRRSDVRVPSRSVRKTAHPPRARRATTSGCGWPNRLRAPPTRPRPARPRPRRSPRVLLVRLPWCGTFRRTTGGSRERALSPAASTSPVSSRSTSPKRTASTTESSLRVRERPLAGRRGPEHLRRDAVPVDAPPRAPRRRRATPAFASAASKAVVARDPRRARPLPRPRGRRRRAAGTARRPRDRDARG